MPAPPTPTRRASGCLVHLLAGLCMLATVALLLLAVATRHSSADLSFAVVLVWLLPLAPFFFGCVFLTLSPRPGLRRLGGWLLVLFVGAAIVLSLVDKLFGPFAPR